MLDNSYKKIYRRRLLDLVYKYDGHLGGSLSSLDLMTVVYKSALYNFKKDHFILSAGHLSPALFVVLGQKDKFEVHASPKMSGLEFAAGSLGQGLSFAAGIALIESKNTVISLTTDGESQEGQIWEATAFASKYHLGNLINIVDCNGYQIDGSTNDIMPLRSLAQKYIQFGWTVTTIDGHDYKQILNALKKAKNSKYPNCIIAKTVLGKGIPFMENNFKYHDVKNLSKELYEKAVDKGKLW